MQPEGGTDAATPANTPLLRWRVQWLHTTDSTNADVASAARDGAAEGLVVVADYQNAGRGRLNRRWEAPVGASVAASFLLRPNVPAARWPWLPLLAGVASAEAIERSAAVTTSLKWPNDVLVDGHKLGGVLVERIETPGGPAAVVGIGINVLQRREELPAGATSLALAGASASREVIVHELGHRLARWYAAWRATAGDPSKGLATTYVDRCHTLGNQVRVILPGGSDLTGKAVDVDKSGRLIVDVAGSRTPVGAGDVIHVRMRDQ